MAALYADENFDYPVVLELRRLGHDVLTAQEAGQRSSVFRIRPCWRSRPLLVGPF